MSGSTLSHGARTTPAGAPTSSGSLRAPGLPGTVIEAVGTKESTLQAICATGTGGHMGFVGVNYDVSMPGIDLYFGGIHVHGGPAPVRRFQPRLIDLVCSRTTDAGKVFDLSLPRDQGAASDKYVGPTCTT